jgi:hypothetical protein
VPSTQGLTLPESASRASLATAPLSCAFGAPRGIRTPNRQIRRLVLCVDLVGSRRVQSDRVDDQTDDQAVRRGTLGQQTSATTVERTPDIPPDDNWRTGMQKLPRPEERQRTTRLVPSVHAVVLSAVLMRRRIHARPLGGQLFMEHRSDAIHAVRSGWSQLTSP